MTLGAPTDIPYVLAHELYGCKFALWLGLSVRVAPVLCADLHPLLKDVLQKNVVKDEDVRLWGFLL